MYGTGDAGVATGGLDTAVLQNRAATIAGMLGAIANERRLRLLCRLASAGEATVTELAGAAGLSASATSQHLGRMRDEAIVTFRREGRTLWYRVADPRIERLLATLQHLFCALPDNPRSKD
ncbi:MAG: helix-turn-helix transcriptional regulator [Bauldia sp.]|nr:helix-turn-helix transcriptional regulator [Bauldia sp.]